MARRCVACGWLFEQAVALRQAYGLPNWAMDRTSWRKMYRVFGRWGCHLGTSWDGCFDAKREDRCSGRRMWRSTRTLRSDSDVRAAYASHGAELYRLALRSLNDTGLAEEAVQDTFLRAWRAAERHDPNVSSLRTWLFAICKNVIIDLHRSRSVRPIAAKQDRAEAGNESADPADPIEETLAAWQIEEAFGRISEEHRQALVETYYKGRSYKELAEEIGVPEGTLRSRVFYGMKALRLALEELGWDHEL